MCMDVKQWVHKSTVTRASTMAPPRVTGASPGTMVKVMDGKYGMLPSSD